MDLIWNRTGGTSENKQVPKLAEHSVGRCSEVQVPGNTPPHTHTHIYITAERLTAEGAHYVMVVAGGHPGKATGVLKDRASQLISWFQA